MQFITLVMKSADGRVKPCCLLVQRVVDGQEASVAALFQVVTLLFDKNRFPVHNVHVVGSTPQARLLYPHVLWPRFGIQ